MSENLSEQLAQLPYLLGGHLSLSVSALLIGVVISVPAGVLAFRSSRLSNPLLTLASVIQTVPSLALLALMVPVLGGTIGFLPAFVALTLYSVLPTLRNTLTGLKEIDPSLIEAARAVGMTPRQRLFRVELPLALPVIIAGIRTASVWVVGTATLSTPVGAPSLGNYIFAGLQTRNWTSVLFGCFFAAALAIIIDQIIRLAESAARNRSRLLAFASGFGLVVILGLGLAPGLIDLGARAGQAGGTFHSRSASPPEGSSLKGQAITIGAKPFTEQYILAGFLEGHLSARGGQVTVLQNLGSTILFDALRNSTIDACVDYTGTLWTTILKRNETLERTAMFLEVARYLLTEHQILAVGRLGFENAYCLAMSRRRAEELGIHTIADLTADDRKVTIGGDPEFFGRPDWIRVRDRYGLKGMVPRSMDSTFMYGAVRDGNVDVIGAYTTDGRIDAFDLVILDDPLQAFPPYDAVLLISPGAREKTGLIEALQPLLNRIDDRLMREANRLVDIQGESPRRAARLLLSGVVVD